MTSGALPRLLARALAYAGLAAALTWPAVIRPVAAVPGAPRTDLADGLWSLWFWAERLPGGPFTRVDGLLNPPHGGSLWVADPVNALLGAPLVLTLGPAAAWTVLVLAHLTFAGLAGHALGERVGGGRPWAGWIAGVGVASSPMLLSQVHNGATEAVGGGWVILAALAVWGLRERGGLRAGVLAGLAMGVATVAHWYAGVEVYLLWALAAVEAGIRRAKLGPWLVAGALGLALAAPVAVEARAVTTAKDNVVGIKSEREIATLRRTIGPADPVGFVHPGRYRSPDFSELSRYQEQYVHCTYLGLVLLAGAAVGLRRDPKGGAVLAVAALGAATLACGPVLARFGAPVILPGRLGIPLPYLLLEKLPGFDGLSLVYRLAWLAVVCLAALAARGLSGRLGWVAVVALLVDARLLSPAADLPGHTDATPSPALLALADAPEGAVMNWPMVGGRPYLYEATVHRHPVAASLNFPANAGSQRVWKAAQAHVGDPPEGLATAVTGAARAAGVRYLVLHDDPSAEPGDLDAAARAMGAALPVLAEAGPVRVIRLY